MLPQLQRKQLFLHNPVLTGEIETSINSTKEEGISSALYIFDLFFCNF
jgi:hypothetical protein